MIDTYSLLVAVLMFNLSMAAVALLRRRTGYLAVYSTQALIFLVLLSALRVIMPFKFDFAHTVYSYDTIPAVETVMQTDVWRGTVLLDVLLLVWGIGSSVMLILFIRTVLKGFYYQRRYKKADNTKASRVATDLGIGQAEIIVSPDVFVPYVTGLLKARIYLPDIDMTDHTMELILKHEYQHFKSRDILVKSFYLLLSIVFWWNPITHLFLRELDRLLEIRCDAALVKHMNENEKTTYMEALLYIAKYVLSSGVKTPARISSFARMEQGGFMEQRFKLIQSGSTAGFKIKQFISIIVVMLIFFASFMINLQPVYSVLTEPLNQVDAVNPGSGPRPGSAALLSLTTEQIINRGWVPNNIIPTGNPNNDQPFPRQRRNPMQPLTDEEIEQRGLGKNLTFHDPYGNVITTDLEGLRAMYTDGVYTGPNRQNNDP